MGIYYLQHFDGDEYYACAACETHIATPDDIVSRVSSPLAYYIVADPLSVYTHSNSMGSPDEHTSSMKCKFLTAVDACRMTELALVRVVYT